jgi:hypothetical protein
VSVMSKKYITLTTSVNVIKLFLLERPSKTEEHLAFLSVMKKSFITLANSVNIIKLFYFVTQGEAK